MKRIGLSDEEILYKVRSRLDYDRSSGTLSWNKSEPNNRAGKLVGTCSNGYLQVTIDQQSFKVHRLIFLLEYGYTPFEVDHIDHDKRNNRPSNLRECTREQNQCNRHVQSNNTSGYKGVDWRKDREKWRTRIKLSGKPKHIGYYSNKHDAARAYNLAAKMYYGEFALLNNIEENE